MKTETQVTIRLDQIRATENLHSNDGYIIKAFFACSRADTKTIKLFGETTTINQTLRISNISGKQLEFWLCATDNRIIANASIPLPDELGSSHEVSVDFKMTTTPFAAVSMAITVNKREIEKPVYVEPDEQLLKKAEDPYEKQRKEQEELKKQKEAEEQANAAKQVKKAPITVTKFNKKDVPLI